MRNIARLIVPLAAVQMFSSSFELELESGIVTIVHLHLDSSPKTGLPYSTSLFSVSCSVTKEIIL